jgi:2-dehydro-3-deoxyphosphogluconate aldolase/(4S)-4-hydroxy-2-oxoglutarate aldolase
MALTLTARQVMDDAPVLPVIVVAEPLNAVLLARSLVAGGIRMLEVTLRTPAALACIKVIAREVPEAVPGAGTVRNAKDARAAVKAGARFLVSPGFSWSVSDVARELGVAYLPGVSTAGEIMQALEDGHTEMKFFPAAPAGGTAILDAWRGPFPDVTFCPTGGISLDSASAFLSLSNVGCVGGSWLVPPLAVYSGNWGEVERQARKACSLRNHS